MKSKNILIIGVINVISIFGVVILSNSGKLTTNTQTKFGSSSQKLIPIDSITHGHGLAVDVENPNNVYIATHHGLLILVNEKDLYRVGDKTDDYMGFSPHPTNARVFFSSGHPATGGNIGFQKSEDGGFNWQKISDGIAGPVDFHAMAVSPVNPDLIFGWYQGAIQQSTDGGKNWAVVGNTNFVTVGLAADTKDENIVYASSPQGMFVSKNKGGSWDRLLDGFVSVVAVNPSNSQKLLSFSEKQRLAKSNDAGKTWEKINESFSGETPLFIAFDTQKPENLYILTEKNSIYKSIDSGDAWSKIR